MAVSKDVKLGQNIKIFHRNMVNLYGCEIGDDTRIGSFVEIQKGVVVGDKCKIESHTFICEGVTIEDEVFIGHGVMFTNDKYPRATSKDGKLQTSSDWTLLTTLVKKGATIGSNVTVLPGVIIGESAIIGAGAVITKDVPARSIVVGNPGRVIRLIGEK